MAHKIEMPGHHDIGSKLVRSREDQVVIRARDRVAFAAIGFAHGGTLLPLPKQTERPAHIGLEGRVVGRGLAQQVGQIGGEHLHGMAPRRQLTGELPHGATVATHFLRRQKIGHDENTQRGPVRARGRRPTGAFPIGLDRRVIQHTLRLERL